MITYDAANRFLAKRLLLPTRLKSAGISKEIPPRVRAAAFFSARVAEDRVLRKIREVSDPVSRGGLSVPEARERLQRWLDAQGIGDPSDNRISNISSAARVNLILNQNAAEAAAVGRYEVSRDPEIEERWPCWRYIAGYNPRAEHAKYDGRVFRKSDPFWKTHYPPWDFNCNCDVEDSDEPAQTAPAGDGKPEAESGFAFDPAHAFEEFDVSGIKDSFLREKTMEGIQERFPEAKIVSGSVEQPRGERTENTTMVLPRTPGDYPKGGKYKQLRPAYDAALRGQDDFIQEIRTRGSKENMNREFVGVFDPDGNPFCVSMGERGSSAAQFQFREGGSVIHNHPGGGTFSTQDVRTFVSGGLKSMTVVTEKHKYTLTQTGKGSKLPIDEIIARFKAAANKTNDKLAAWKEALDGTGSEIRVD